MKFLKFFSKFFNKNPHVLDDLRTKEHGKSKCTNTQTIHEVQQRAESVLGDGSLAKTLSCCCCHLFVPSSDRGGEWSLKRYGSRKILVEFNGFRSLIFEWFCMSHSLNFFAKPFWSLELGLAI